MKNHTMMKKIYSILSIICLALFAASCSNELQEEAQNAGKGYLKLDITTLTSTHTRAVMNVPQGYDARTLAVKITNSAGTVVKETQDVANDNEFKGNIILAPDTYTITASSAGWDGSNSAFGAPYYVGTTTATVRKNTLVQASLTLTQANVKVTVNYDNNFRTYFSEAKCIVTSALADVSMQVFSLTTTGSAYFPVANLNFFLAVTNKSGESFTMSKDVTDVKARDHFIINYKIAEAGSIGGVTVIKDDATQSYTFDIEVPRKSSLALNASAANAFATFANLTGAVTAKTSSFDENSLKLQWKKESDDAWTDVPVSQLIKGEQDTYTYKLTNLTPATKYVYRMNYSKDETNSKSNEVKFTTESLLQPENAGFEDWWKDGDVWYPNANGSHYWDSSNPGSASMGEEYNVTSRVGGAHSGLYAAQLKSTYVIIKFAAASIYTGEFDHLVGTKGAVINWGQPFTSRPSKLTGWMKYTPGSINRGTQPAGAPVSGSPDECQIFCALLTKRLTIDNTDIEGTFPKWDGSDSRIIAYGAYTQNTTDSDWKQFNIPLTYYNTTRKPTHVLIVCSSSKYGDYFYGSDSSKLLLDDFEFVYDEPTFNQ